MILKGERMQEVVVEEPERFGFGDDQERPYSGPYNGAIVGVLVGFARGGEALVDVPGTPMFRRVPARSCIPVTASDIGKEALLLFEGGEPTLPIIIGLAQRPGRKAHSIARFTSRSREAHHSVELDGKKLELTARETITLRCGEASITLSKDGKIVIRGVHVISHAAGVNRVRGGTVQLN
jgi:hypothetical protein